MVGSPIVIFGAGGFGREVLQLIHDINLASSAGSIWDPIGFLVDPEYVSDRIVNGIPILGGPDWLSDHPEVKLILAVGSPAVRLRMAAHLRELSDDRYATLIHPRAWLGSEVRIGAGSIVCAGALVTTNISIGQHVHVNIGSTIGHDAILGNYVTLNPSVNVSGNVRLSTGAEIGTGSVLIPHADIGEWSIIGAGSVVTKPIPENSTAVGSPAKVIKTREEGWQLR